MTPAILAPAAALGTSTKVLSFPRCHLGTKAPRVYFSEESSSVAVMGAGHRTRRRSTCTRAAKTTSEDRIALQTIDDLDRDYCNDFECQSSPAVEQTVRSFARATTMLRYNQGLFQPDVQYTDGFRTFQGAVKYSNQRWYAENVQKPTVTITKMKMLDKATAQIDWRVTGAMGGGQVDIGVTSVITMNLLTGRITNHKETWDLSKVPPPAAMTATMGRMVWSLKRNAADAGEKVSNKVSESLGSMSGDDEPQIYNNPADPTKFFQGNDNSQWNDYVSYAFLAALLYFAFKAFGELEKLS